MRKYETGNGQIAVSELTVQNSSGFTVPIGYQEDFDISVANILSGIHAGEVGASKSALFENTSDAGKGIVKNILEIAAKPLNGGIDIVIVLDVSLSMATVIESTNTDGETVSESRIAIVRQAAISMASEILSDNPNNRISVITFSDQVKEVLDFTSDLTAVQSMLPYQATGRGTNYEVGLNQAEYFLNNRNDTDRSAYVLLMTDGAPNQGDAISGANSLKNDTNAVLYCVGIQSDATDIISEISTDGTYFQDCSTKEEIVSYMAQITQGVSLSQSAIIHEEITDRFEILCDAEHPITMEGIEYTSISDIPSEFMIDSDNNKSVTWNLSTVNSEGSVISYYTKMSECINAGEDGVGVIGIYNGATLEYCRNYVDNIDQVQTDDTPVIIEMDLPSVKLETTILSVTISSDKMHPNDMSTGKTLTYGESINYTVTVKNTGSILLQNVMIQGIVPAGAVYLSSLNGTPDTSETIVSTSISSLSPGMEAEMSFAVRVTDKEGSVSCTGFAGLASEESGEIVKCETNTLVNPLISGNAYPGNSGKPVGSEEVTERPTVPSENFNSFDSTATHTPQILPSGTLCVRLVTKAADVDKIMDFSITVTLSDTSINGKYGDMIFVNGVAIFSLRYSETATANELPSGITYSIEISSPNCITYVNGVAGSIAFGSIVADEISRVIFTHMNDTCVNTEDNAGACGSEDATASTILGYLQNTDSNFCRLLVALVILLSAVLCMQILSIASDMRVLKWYNAKKKRFLQRSR